jgi:hypothetical protein
MAHTKESRRKDEAKAALQIAQKVTRAAIAKGGASKKTGGAQKGEVVNKKRKTSGKAEAPAKTSGKAEAPAKTSGKAEAGAQLDLKDTRPCDRGFYPYHPKIFEKKQLREFTRFDVTNRNEVLVFYDRTDRHRKGFYRGLITDLCDSLHPKKLVSTLSPLSRSSSLFLLVVCSSYVRQRFSSSALCVGNCFKSVDGF